MGIDEIVDEADTATAIRRYLDTLAPIENLRSPRQEGKHR
jgi:hypothetical protein